MLVLPTAVQGVLAGIGQDVVHPPHVPLKGEAESADPGRPADGGKRRRLLGDHRCAGKLAMRDSVQLPQEINGVEVLAPAV